MRKLIIGIAAAWLAACGVAQAQDVQSRVFFHAGTCTGTDQQFFDSMSVPAGSHIIGADIVLNQIPTSGMSYGFIGVVGGPVVLWLGANEAHAVGGPGFPGFHAVGPNFMPGGFLAGPGTNVVTDFKCNSGSWQSFITYFLVV